MRNLIVPIALLAAAGVALAAYATNLRQVGGRADCPGKIVCPRTGQLVCRDQCPTADPDRPDCPGRLECPLTGELVCVDRCPLGGGATKGDEAVRTYCRGRK